LIQQVTIILLILFLLSVGVDIFTVFTDLAEKQGEVGADPVIRFPITIGLTGNACSEKTILYSNSIESELRYNSDIDNLIGIHNFKNILVSEICLEEKNTLPVGVIQLINKKGEDPISEYDVVSIAHVVTILLGFGECTKSIFRHMC
jgi:hypothetical protein